MLFQRPLTGHLLVTAIITMSTSAMAQQPATIPNPPAIQQYLQPQDPTNLLQNQLLGIPGSCCGHVIDLLMHNRIRQQTGQTGSGEVMLPHLTAGISPGDLQLQCVHLVCDGDNCKGPVFQIGMKNESNVPIGNFRVSIVGVLGQIHLHSPSQTIHISRMEACEELQIQMQLPVTCMAMTCNAAPCPFDTLVVAVDSCDQLMECNELNNVQILKRCDITPLATETVAVTPAGPGTSLPNSVSPGPAIADAAPAAPAAPEIPAAPENQQPTAPESSPLDNLDLDSLQIGDAQNLFLRNR